MIYASHGVVDNFCSKKFCHRNLLDLEKLENHLKSKKEKYVSLEKAIAGKGDAFTIDDATHASFEAAKLLKKYDHSVTLFVNPYYIEHKVNYWFAILNYLLDTTSFENVLFDNILFPIVSLNEKQIFRKKLKQKIAELPTETERHSILSGLFKLNLDDIVLPKHLNTITEEDLLKLQGLGVDLQNHGWTHRELKNASEAEKAQEIFLGKNWLQNKLKINACFYAVPFGSALPKQKTVNEVMKDYNFSHWFLLENSLELGPLGKIIYNRQSFGLLQSC